MKTDAEILALYHSPNKEEAGFSLIIEKYQQKIYWHIRRIVLEHDDANDVMQNTFIKIWNGLPNFRADSQLYTWIYRIATNESITFLNQRKKHGQHISFDGNDSEENEFSNAPSNYIKSESTTLDPEKLLERLKTAIESLPEKQRIVFSMRYYDEMPYEEMSRVLGTSEGALKASYFHAAQKIEKYLLAED